MKLRQITTIRKTKDREEFMKALTIFIFEGGSLMQIAKYFRVDYLDLQKYIKSRCFKNIEYNGVKYRKCSFCIYKTLDKFYSLKDRLDHICIDCARLNSRNYHKIAMNTRFLKKSSKYIAGKNASSKKYASKIRGILKLKKNTKRRFNNILKNNFRILKIKNG